MEESHDFSKLGGFSIGRRLYFFIRENFVEGGTILELGSGLGTDFLSRFYKMVSIEDNPSWLNRYKSTYIYAPLVDKWYDAKRIAAGLYSNISYGLFLVDGPSATIAIRSILLKHLDIFDLNCMIILDDIQREDERILFESLANVLGRRSEVFEDEGKRFGAIYKV